MKILDFYRISPPSAVKIAHDKVQKAYKRQRMQTFLAATFGYALYYVCRLSMGVMKQPIIDAGLLNATQLGIVGACLYWTYAVGKLVNGFLADSANIKRFMATGIIISVGMNFIMGVLGVGALNGTIANSVLFISFCVFWAINGFAQSMGAPASIVSLSRWFPLKSRGTYYGIFSASHNIGEGLSFIFVGSIVAAFGWKWGFFGAALAGLIGFILVLLCFHDNPDSKGLPPIEVLSGEKTQEEYDATFEAEAIAAKDAQAARRLETKRMQKAVIKNPGVWILQRLYVYEPLRNQRMGHYLPAGSQRLRPCRSRRHNRRKPGFRHHRHSGFGMAVGCHLQGRPQVSRFRSRSARSHSADAVPLRGPRKMVNILSMVLFGIAIGVLISFLGGLMAVDLVPRKASGAALGIVGIASYAAAGLQNIVTGLLLDNNIVGGVHDFTYVSWFWLGSAVISFLLPILNWKRKKQEI